MERNVLIDAFDSFVSKHNLYEIWADRLFGRDEELANQKVEQAWNLLRKLTNDGQCELEDGGQLDFLLRKACGMPTAKALNFRKPASPRVGCREKDPQFASLATRRRLKRERDKAATARLRAIMRAESTNPPQPNP